MTNTAHPHPTRKTSLAAALAAVVALAAGIVAAAGSHAGAAPAWADAGSATIHPGVQMYTDGAQCTANFVFTDAAADPGQDPAVYLGYAAHCAGLGAANETNGCDSGSLPVGTEVEIDGASEPGILAYSSWATMQQVGETDADACNHNDFALVRIHPDDVAAVNPSIPFWGGPTGLNTTGNGTLASVYSYGNSSLRFGITALSPKEGVSLGTSGGGWTHPVYTMTPGVPGDSGSAMLDADGRASGVLSTLTILPTAGSNNFSDLASALDYLRAHTSLDVELALGTEAFDPGALLLGL